MIDSINMFENLDEYSGDISHACFFTGHRKVPENHKSAVTTNIRSTVSYLYSKGVTDFHAGGALGFDTLAATQILDIKREHPNMRLILDLPYRNQDEKWAEPDRRIYNFVIEQADEVHYAFDGVVTSRAQSKKYLLMRNRLMADRCLYCISYYNGNVHTGTGYTIKYAKENDIEIINLYPEHN